MAGTWVGTLTLDQGPEFVLLRIQGDVRNMGGSLEMPFSTLKTLPLADFRRESTRLQFEVHAASRSLVFVGQFRNGRISGEVQQTGRRGTFDLIRLAEVDPKLLREYAGAYRVGRDRFLFLQTWAEVEDQLTCVDTDGKIRVLFPVTETSFVTGPSLLLPLPIQEGIQFHRNPEGEVTHLVVQATGMQPETAPRANLYSEENVRFRNGDVELEGMLRLPSGPGPHPAIILVHGSGPQDRYNLLPFVNNLPTQGIALLGYDKRGVGASTGDWRVADFDELAEDVLAAVRFLRSHAAIDAKPVGLFGVSQGGWIAPLAASRSGEVAFVISVSGPGVTPAQQELDRVQGAMRASKCSEDEIAQALSLWKLVFEFARTGKGWEALEAAFEKPENETLLSFVPRIPRDHWIWGFWRHVLDYDPLPVLEKVRCPVLALFGGLDRLVPAEENRTRWEGALRDGRNRDHTVRVFPEGNHLLLAVESDRLADFPRAQGFLPEYLETVREWLEQRVTMPR